MMFRRNHLSWDSCSCDMCRRKANKKWKKLMRSSIRNQERAQWKRNTDD